MHVPAATRNATEGPNLGPIDKKDVRTFEKLFVVNPWSDASDASKVQDTLQQYLYDGYDIIIAPGIYYLTSSLLVECKNKNQVILGLGMATLVAPPDGSPCIKVEDDSIGIRIAALILQALDISKDKYDKSTLLEIGTFRAKKNAS